MPRGLLVAASALALRASAAASAEDGMCEATEATALLQSRQPQDWWRRAALSPRSRAATRSAGACTGGNDDPWRTGKHVPCCAGLEECLDDWHHTGTWSYKCLDSCDGGKPSPSDLSICKKTTAMTASSVWQVGSSAHSCKSNDGIRGDGAFSCVRENGEVDLTSIQVDMRKVHKKTGCFEWVTKHCEMPMRKVRSIDFDVEWESCDALWVAPIWMFSDPWVPPQGTSGEVDFVEACPTDTISTNLGCYSTDRSKCKDAEPWARASSSNGPKHVTMTINDVGDLEVQVCNLDRTGCQRVASYTDYLNSVYPTSHGRDNVFRFISDIWNDRGGDPGWAGCKAVKNPRTECRYAVTNIKVSSKSQGAIFGDSASRCLAMNPV